MALILPRDLPATTNVSPLTASLIIDNGATVERVTPMQLAEATGGKGDPGGNTMAIGPFTAASTFTIPDGTDLVQTSGYSANGIGAGLYTADDDVDAEFVAAHPSAAFLSVNARGFRLLPDPAGLIAVSQMGVAGTNSSPDDAWRAANNHQPGFQAAIDYSAAIAAAGIRCDHSYYSLWCPLREAEHDHLNPNTAGGYSGSPILIHRKTTMEAAPGGTELIRRKWDGSDPAVFEGTQEIHMTGPGNPGMRHWRGGMFFLVGQGTASPGSRPADYDSLAGLVLRGKWKLSGGLPMSDTPGGYTGGETGYFDLRDDGDGWDVTDKAFWFHNDRHTGDLEFDELWIDGFRGEVIYQGGNTHGSIHGRRLRISNTDGTAFNPGPCWSREGGVGGVGSSGDAFGTAGIGGGYIDIDHLHIHNCYRSMEGGFGTCAARSRIGELVLEDNDSADLLNGAGEWFSKPGDYTPSPRAHIGLIRARATGAIKPYGATDIDRIEMTDSRLIAGQASSMPNLDPAYRFHEIVIGEVVGRNETGNLPELVSLNGSGGAGALSLARYRIGSIRGERTAKAIAESFVINRPVSFSGSIGPGVFVGEVSGEFVQGSQQSTTTHDMNVGFGRQNHTVTNSSNGFNAETTPTLDDGRPWYGLTTTATSGNFPVTLPEPALYPPGAHIRLRHQTNANVVFSIQTAGTRMNRRMLLPALTTVEFVNENSAAWVPLNDHPKRLGSATINIDSIGANALSSIETITVNGALAGMTVDLVLPDSVAADNEIVRAWVSADNTVSFQLRDLTGSGNDPASGAYRVSLEWPN